MANTNTNLLSVGSSKNVAVTSQSTSAKYKTAAPVDRKDNFNSHLDKANAQVNQNQSQQPEKVEGDIKETAETIQGQNTKTQDAPPQENLETPPENISEGTEELSDADEVQENPALFSYLFSANTETLLAVRDVGAETEGNLMTIMPQSSDSKSQSMLDLLGGKTWTSADVTTEFQNLNSQPQTQNLNQLQIETVQPQVQNLNQQAQVETVQPQMQNLNQQVQVENFQPQQNLNQQSQVENIQPQQNLNQQSQVETVQPQMQNVNQQSQVETVQPQMQNLNQQTQIETFQPQQNVNQQQVETVQPQVQNLNQQAQVETVQPQVQNLNSQSQVETVQPQQNLNSQVQVETVQSQVQNLNQQMQFENIQPQVQNLNQSQPTVQNMADLLGVNVQVEDGQQIAPTVQTQQPSQNFEQNNSQSNAQNFSQNLTQATSPEIQQATSQTAEGGENFAANFAQANNISQPIQQTTQIQTPETAATAREDFNIPTQIVEQARLIRSAQNTEMVINLKPEHLGELTLRISVNHSGALTANFYSDNAQVRAIIDNSLVQLRQELNNAGIKVENVQVYAGLSDGGLSNGQSNAWQQNQQQRNSNRKIDFSAFEDEASATQPVNDSETSDGVDYKV